MKKLTYLTLIIFSLLGVANAQTFNSSQQYEKLSRGVVAVKTDSGVFVSWRVLGTDDAQATFNLYRDGKLINKKPLTVSNFTDTEGTETSSYVVKTLDGKKEIETSEAVKPWGEAYLTLNICPPVEDNTLAMPQRGDRPQTGERPQGNRPQANQRPEGDRPNRQGRPERQGRWNMPRHKYSPADCTIADVDGDGNYEIILKWDPYNAHDNAHTGFTDPVYIDCYRLTGAATDGNNLLWRINLGRNIRAGAHYTQILAYDFDGDGKAEVACKTAPGTIDGKGNYVLLPGDDKDADYVGKEGGLKGRIIGGPEYLTVFSGLTGEALATAPYKPAYKDVTNWGDDHFNRSERYLACVAYLDGKKPSMVFCRGYYTPSNLAAYDFDGKNLSLRWLHQSLYPGENSAYGQGAHSLAVGDIDNDGCDEIIYGSATIDHDGKCLSSTGLGHGDAIHLSDLLPDRPGLELFMVHEGRNANYCAEIHDPATGEILWREDSQTGEDNGRGVAIDCLPDTKGYSWWSISSNNIFTTTDGKTGTKVGTIAKGSHRPTNFRIYWDGDILEEPYDGNTVYKPSVNGEEVTFNVMQQLKGSACNGTKNTPNILADIFGDWREEVILYDRDTCDKLYIHTTTIPTEHRVPTLMHDHIYRMAIAWQNVSYNQPPHLGYNLKRSVNKQ